MILHGGSSVESAKVVGDGVGRKGWIKTSSHNPHQITNHYENEHTKV